MKTLAVGLSTAALVLTGCAAVANGESAHVRGNELQGQDPAFDMIDYRALSLGHMDLRGTETRGDLVAYTARHAAGRITARLRVREMEHERGTGYEGTLALETPSESYVAYTGRVIPKPGRARDGVRLVHEETLRPVRCPGLDGGVSYDSGSFWISIPRVCLQSPRWIRVYAATTFWVRRTHYTVVDFAPAFRQFSDRLYAGQTG